jgi:hypothetical protein
MRHVIVNAAIFAAICSNAVHAEPRVIVLDGASNKPVAGAHVMFDSVENVPDGVDSGKTGLDGTYACRKCDTSQYDELNVIAATKDKSDNSKIKRTAKGWPEQITLRLDRPVVYLPSPQQQTAQVHSRVVYERRLEVYRDFYGREYRVIHTVPVIVPEVSYSPQPTSTSACAPCTSPWWMPFPDPRCN